MASRIVLVGFYHETNTFSATTTDMALFERYQFVEGEALVARYRGTGTELGGAIGEIERRGDVPVGVLFASAIPSGPITRDCLEAIIARIRDELSVAAPYDGIVVVLHGAAGAVGVPDADGAVLDAVRGVVGKCPLVATIDFHANVSARMVEQADAIVGYDTYPHVDMAERGKEAVALLMGLIRGDRLSKAHRKLPLLTVPQVQSTDDAPMADIMRFVRRVEARDGIASATVAMGFPYADSGDLGASVLVYGDEAASELAANDIADTIWHARDAFHPSLSIRVTLPRSSGRTPRRLSSWWIRRTMSAAAAPATVRLSSTG
jgi:microcystin degradation protein MlrC